MRMRRAILRWAGVLDVPDRRQKMSDEALATLGANSSLIHVDWMIGSAEMDVDGIGGRRKRAADARGRVGVTGRICYETRTLTGSCKDDEDATPAATKIEPSESERRRASRRAGATILRTFTDQRTTGRL